MYLILLDVTKTENMNASSLKWIYYIIVIQDMEDKIHLHLHKIHI